MDYPSEVGQLFAKISELANNAHQELSSIIQDHSNAVHGGINGLAQEVSDLKTKLTAITNERNDLIGKVSDLTIELTAISSERDELLATVQDLRNAQESHENDAMDIEGCSTAGQTQYSRDEMRDSDMPVGSQEDRNFTSSDSDLFADEPLDDTPPHAEDTEGHLAYSVPGQSQSEEVPQAAGERHDVQTSTISSDSETTINESVNVGEPRKKKVPASYFDSFYTANIIQEENYLCPHCNFGQTTSENLRIHYQQFHPELEPLTSESIIVVHKIFRCAKCLFETADHASMNEHIITVHDWNMSNHVCRACGYAAPQKDILKKHIEEVHMGKRSHVCGECGYVASKKGKLNIHITAVHEKIRDHVCGECGYATSYKGALKRHIEAKHENKRSQPKSKNHGCGICGFTSASRYNLKQHIASVHENAKQYACKECEYTSNFEIQLKTHITTVHEKIKNHVCGLCGKAFPTKSKLDSHTKGVHEKIRDHVCQECGKAFTQNCHLQLHIKVVHEKIRDHVCEECGESFSMKSNLDSHIRRVHEKIRDHVCQECGTAYSMKSDLKRHKETAHRLIA